MDSHLQGVAKHHPAFQEELKAKGPKQSVKPLVKADSQFVLEEVGVSSPHRHIFPKPQGGKKEEFL